MDELPIIDSHVHLYDPAKLSYPWMAAVPALNKPHLPGDFDRARGSIKVAGMVFVEVDAAEGDRLAEAHWVGELATLDPRIGAIVAAAPVELGERMDSHLDKLTELPLVRGVRRLIQDEPDPRFCVRPDFIEGVRLLGRRGLSFDICVYHHQMPAAVELARSCPDVALVLDHVGKPGIRAGLIDQWKADIGAMAELPNVWCKLSGMATEADHSRWGRDDLRPYMDHVIESFGFDRLMFGGDWPVSTLATDYARWVETVLWATKTCSDTERRRLMGGTAAAFYRLPQAL
ncbi:amidohydrolase [Skermanella stibiiresistens SB22]|uniref:Amidohydrolase n=1 Tax=Skermanella stibiiresistens SB22 TaxID=1385369 RepID=W9H1X7_9PROT|nr:amidohydrolase family protein [Skermanella stibiiresistens]EWY40175.1 amidohydrolase [Skermanella stibiiresistens SB22]